ncbi:hypothetical protein [Streptomyces sp. G-G2]|uniref:hypothetical protein n=1 Tax=Streptomyces sp. G-G2 TaxID=3046201 RepID=UPI0024B8E4E4|nr:hypothetical protein [Streptomyces sp. G-G2]MDJ0379341.1 hypothetical protein [Streptomyces sp. G-G2]
MEYAIESGYLDMNPLANDKGPDSVGLSSGMSHDLEMVPDALQCEVPDLDDGDPTAAQRGKGGRGCDGP